MENKKINVLLVEDDVFLSKMYQAKLDIAGFNVAATFNGEDGLAMAQKNLPGIILLDIILPKMDGYQVLKQLKKVEATKNIPVILLTNMGQKEDIDRGLALGAVDYLIKAYFTPAEVVKKIQKVIS